MTNPSTAPVVLSAREIEVLYSALGAYASEWEGVTEDANIHDALALRERLRPLLPLCGPVFSDGTTEGDEEAPESEEPGFAEDDGQPSSWDERRDFAGDDDYGGSSFDDGGDW